MNVKQIYEPGDLCVHKTFGLGMFLREGNYLGECFFYSFETDIHIYEYNPTSYAIHSTEHFGKAFKEQIKNIGGIYKLSY